MGVSIARRKLNEAEFVTAGNETQRLGINGH
jgi:hypothetical protein